MYLSSGETLSAVALLEFCFVWIEVFSMFYLFYTEVFISDKDDKRKKRALAFDAFADVVMACLSGYGASFLDTSSTRIFNLVASTL